MKQIVFISGKGGTGKSTLVSSLSKIVKEKLLADCDVDAPNLHILLKGQNLKKNNFSGAKVAVVDSTLCVKCGLCKQVCRFDAINDNMEIISMKCEGCGACTLVCPENAISLNNVKTGETFITNTSDGIFSHALLDIGAEGSGKLVTEVRKNISEFVDDQKWLLIDGSPGIGCAVIASVTGADAVVAVCEPTKSGLSDLERVLGVANHFKVPSFVCINKYDLNLEVTADIEDLCKKTGSPIIGMIPFELAVVKALQEFKTPVDAGIESVTKEIFDIWNRLISYLS